VEPALVQKKLQANQALVGAFFDGTGPGTLRFYHQVREAQGAGARGGRSGGGQRQRRGGQGGQGGGGDRHGRSPGRARLTRPR